MDLVRARRSFDGAARARSIKIAFHGQIADVLEQLGFTLRGGGLRDGRMMRVAGQDYGTVAEAILWTLEKGLGPEFTPERRDAWIAVYTILAETMKRPAAAE